MEYRLCSQCADWVSDMIESMYWKGGSMTDMHFVDYEAEFQRPPSKHSSKPACHVLDTSLCI